MNIFVFDRLTFDDITDCAIINYSFSFFHYCLTFVDQTMNRETFSADKLIIKSLCLVPILPPINKKCPFSNTARLIDTL